ncbi:MAG: aminoglycoside phosphotransferase family protein [Planctomycetota bacterium]
MQQGRQNPREHDDPAALARLLEGPLRAACEPHLSGEIEWFRATWQRGGAATGAAVWRDHAGHDLPVVIKLPVGAAELACTRALGAHGSDRDLTPSEVPHPTPRVLSAGSELGGYDIGWLVVERLEGSTVGSDLSEASLAGLVRAAVEFQARAAANEDSLLRPAGRLDRRDWSSLIASSRQAVRDNPLAEQQRWNEAIKRTQKSLPSLLERWQARPADDWCHGDLHPGNALHMPGGGGRPDRCVLIDLGLVHRGHWIEDAVYLERVFWGHESHLHGVEPVRAMRAERKRRGLRVRGSDGDLANIKRVLTAASVPARFAGEGGDRAYLEASLDRLERLLPVIAG